MGSGGFGVGMQVALEFFRQFFTNHVQLLNNGVVPVGLGSLWVGGHSQFSIISRGETNSGRR